MKPLKDRKLSDFLLQMKKYTLFTAKFVNDQVNSLRKWELGWTSQVDAIRSSERLGELIKIILCWIVKIRIVIADIYTITYLANFYSILTWCRGGTLVPWIIVSAFDNFLLEFIGFAITLLLWLEKSISSALFIEYMIARAIPRVPAVYYWCIINVFRADLHENQRRKLIQANLNAHQNVSRISEIAERIRFGGVSYSKDYSEKTPRFASLTNLDDFSLPSTSSKYDDDQDSYKRSKSLITIMSIDSLESDDPDEYRILSIFDDKSLTRTEKAMKILNITDSDINETRMRLQKSASPGPSKVERTDKVISTFEQTIEDITSRKLSRNVSLIAPNSTSQVETTHNVMMNKETLPGSAPSLGNIKKSTENKTMVETETDNETSSKVSPHDKIHRQNVLNVSLRNPLSGCICGRADEGSITPNIPDSGDDLEESSDESHGCQGDDDDSSREITGMERSLNESKKTQIEEDKSSTFLTNDRAGLDLAHDVPLFPEWPIADYLEPVPTLHMRQHLPFKTLLLHNVREKEKKALADNLKYPEDMETANYQLYRIDDITIERSAQQKNPENIPDPNTTIKETPGRERRREKSYAQSTDENFPADSAGMSISTQTNISDSWETSSKHDRKAPDVSVDRESFRLPITYFSHSNIPDRLSNKAKIFCRFSRTKGNLEKIKDPEAREMKALRAYNKLTLLAHRRGMETKKNKSSFSNWIGIQDLIYTSDLTNHSMRELPEFGKSFAGEKKEYKVGRDKLDHVQKSRTRSIPKEKTFKLSAFNVKIDALKASISSGFSGDNKTRYRSNNAYINRHNTIAGTNQDSRKQLSKYSKPMIFQEDTNASYQSAMRIEDRNEDHEILKVQKDGYVTNNIPSSVTDHKSLKNIFPRTTLTSVIDAEIRHDSDTKMDCLTDTIEEVRDRQRVSSMREAIMSIDWSFNGRISNEMNFAPPYENLDWPHENFLWDILDETNTITLLQSAFSSNPENTSRGFYLGPGSSELYYVSNCMDGVVEEIMKTAKLRVRNDASTIQSISEIDYGDSYFQEFTVTGIETSEYSSEDTLTDSDSATYETSPDNKTINLTTIDSEEMYCNSYSAENSEIQPDDLIKKKVIEVNDIPEEKDIESKYLKEWALKNIEKRSITDILGHEELSHLEYWTRELKKLASNNHRSDSSEFTSHMQHLTALPGFCVVQKIMDFCRDFVAVSRTTMTSSLFLNRNETDPSNSSVTNSMTSQSNQPLVVGTSNDSPNVETVNDHIDNCPEFYFGTPDDRHFLANEILHSMSKEENHRLNIDTDEQLNDLEKIKRDIIPEDIQVYPMINQSLADSKRKNDLFLPSSIIESSSQLRNSDVALQDVQHPFKTDAAVDSYDSLYSATGNSNCSNNTVSIGCHSSMEEFSLDPSDPTEPRHETPKDITHADINH